MSFQTSQQAVAVCGVFVNIQKAVADGIIITAGACSALGAFMIVGYDD